MYKFDSQTLTAFLNENKNFFEGARIQKIQQPNRREFVFSLRNNGETRKFYLNINPNFYHLCFMNKENAENRAIEIPQKPPMFCMLLRKYIENSQISKVKQPPYERIFEIYIETINELQDKIYLCLAIELMGKHSNVVLYNDDTNVIIGCAHNIGEEKSRERMMAGNLPYIYPSQTNMIKDFTGIKTFSSEMIDPNISVNEAIDNYFSNIQKLEKIKSLRAKLTTATAHRLKKAANSLLKMETQIRNGQDGDKYRVLGDLIMSNLYHGKDFSPSIEIIDYAGNPQKIELDETKTLKANANRYYKLYRKSKTSNEKLSELSGALKIEKNYLEQVLYTIENAATLAELAEIQAEIEPSPDKTKTSKTQKQHSINVKTLTIEGFTVFVGKNNKQNDYIVSKLARDDDLWFHIKDCAGSHVLLKQEKGGQIATDKIILACAKLAKENSSGAESLKVSVIYTKRKNLKKPPASHLGYVTYLGEKEILV